MTSEKHILDLPKNGLKLEFLDESPQSNGTKERFSISQETFKLIKKKVQSIAEKDDLLSPVFL